MATKYAQLPALVDENGVMVGYVDANHKERDLSGALVAPGTTPSPPGGGVELATTAPVALAATAAVGNGTTAARNNHVHPFPTQILTGRSFTLQGGVTGVTASAFTGAANALINTTLATPTGVLRGGVLAQTVADVAADPTQAEFNALLAALRTAGVLTA